MYQKFCSLPKIIRMFGLKTAIFAPKKLSRAYIDLSSSFGALLVGWLVVEVCAGCILQDTYLLYSRKHFEE